jgi:hypothetical protein
VKLAISRAQRILDGKSPEELHPAVMDALHAAHRLADIAAYAAVALRRGNSIDEIRALSAEQLAALIR